MKLTDIILREGVEKRMINFLDDMHRNKQTISVAAFMKEFGVDKQEAIDFIHRWNISKVDRSVMEEKNCGCGETPCKTYGITEENRYNEDGYDEGDIKLMNDIKDCYQNKNVYYKCINSLGIPYLRNPKKNKSFEKEINYRKHKHISHLLPYKPPHHY